MQLPHLQILLVLAGSTVVAGVACYPRGRTGSGRGALDRIVMSEHTTEEGIVVFDHHAHYASGDDGGAGIGCRMCHHDYNPNQPALTQACRVCHPTHDHTRLQSRVPL